MLAQVLKISDIISQNIPIPRILGHNIFRCRYCHSKDGAHTAIYLEINPAYAVPYCQECYDLMKNS